MSDETTNDKTNQAPAANDFFSTVQGVLRVALLIDGATLPTRAHEGDAGLDIYSPVDVLLSPCDTGTAVNSGSDIYSKPITIDSGIAIELKPGEVGLILPRSGSNKKGLHVYTGVIDSGYRGPLGIVVQNMNPDASFRILKGDRIAQLVILPVKSPKPVQVPALSVSVRPGSRGTDGFGSTGK